MKYSLKELYKDLNNNILVEAKIDVVKKQHPNLSIYLDFFKDVKPKYFDWIANNAKNQKDQPFNNEKLNLILNDPYSENARRLRNLRK